MDGIIRGARTVLMSSFVWKSIRIPSPLIVVLSIDDPHTYAGSAIGRRSNPCSPDSSAVSFEDTHFADHPCEVEGNPTAQLRAPRCLESSSPIQSVREHLDRKSTRLNSSHVKISYAVF